MRVWISAALAGTVLVGINGCKTADPSSEVKDVGNPVVQSCKALRYMHASAQNILRAAEDAGRQKGCVVSIPELLPIDMPKEGTTVPTNAILSGNSSLGLADAPAATAATAEGPNATAVAAATTAAGAAPADTAAAVPDAANNCTALTDLTSRWTKYMAGIKLTWDTKNCTPEAEAREAKITVFDHPTCGPADPSVSTEAIPAVSTCDDNYNDTHHTVCYTCQPEPFDKIAAPSAITCQTEIEARSAIDLWCSENDCKNQETRCRVAGTAEGNPGAVTDTSVVDKTTLSGNVTTTVTVKGEAGVFGNKVGVQGGVSVTLGITARVQVTSTNQASPPEVIRDDRTEYGTNTTYSCGYSITGSVARTAGGNVEVGFKIPLTDTGATVGISVNASGAIERSLDFASGAHPAGGKTRPAVLADCLNRGKEQAVAVLKQAQSAIMVFVRNQAVQSPGFVKLVSKLTCNFAGSGYGVKGVAWQLIPRRNPDYADIVRIRLKTDNYFGETESPDDANHGIIIYSSSPNVVGEGHVSFQDIWSVFSRSTPDAPPDGDFLKQVLNSNPFTPATHKWHYDSCE